MGANPLAWMRERRRRLMAFFGAVFVFSNSGAFAEQAPRGQGRVALADVEGAIDPGSGEFLRSAIRRAEQGDYEALVIRLDTPGGLVSTTREIVKDIFESQVPVIVWVAPSGARAGSAGVFITLAAHVAAMAPATNIGAAHPVDLLGKDDGEEKGDGNVMKEKIENDVAAFVASIAQERGRNVEWAISAVRESKSIPAQEAVEKKVVDLIAPDLRTLLEKVDGRKVTLGAAKIERELKTRDAGVDELGWGLRHRFLHVIGEPTVASILLSLGVLGIMLEFYKPGAIVPGVAGVILLLFGVIGISALPVNVGAIVLLVAGIALFVAELFITSYGLLGVAGAICFAAGGILLVGSSGEDFYADRDFGVDAWAFLPTAFFVAVCAIFIGYKAVEVWRKRPTVGDAGLVGEHGDVDTAISPEHPGVVFVHGELWRAVADRSFGKGDRVRVAAVDGLTIRVDAIEP